MLGTMRTAAIVIVVIALWLGAIYALGEGLGELTDTHADCERAVNCEVSPQDALEPH